MEAVNPGNKHLAMKMIKIQALAMQLAQLEASQKLHCIRYHGSISYEYSLGTRRIGNNLLNMIHIRVKTLMAFTYIYRRLGNQDEASTFAVEGMMAITKQWKIPDILNMDTRMTPTGH